MSAQTQQNPPPKASLSDAKAWNWFDGKWFEGNTPIMGPLSHSIWLGSIVFDGARYFEGVAPDLDLHCQRVINSAKVLGMQSPIDLDRMLDLCWEGIGQFSKTSELYIRPMLYAEEGFIMPYAETTRFCLTLTDMPIPKPDKGATACFSSYKRPLPDTAPTDAKASCHYPLAGMALKEASEKGFQNAVMADPMGNVAEFASANIFIAKDGVLHTPVPNRTFLNGITRQRIIKLMRGAGIEVIERTVSFDDILQADEVFSTGNHAKVTPFVKVEDKEFDIGPLALQARDLYWEFAHQGRK